MGTVGVRGHRTCRLPLFAERPSAWGGALGGHPGSAQSCRRSRPSKQKRTCITARSLSTLACLCACRH